MKKPESEHGSAAYVVAHATWRRQRGRPPSATFGNIRNPQLALAAAREVLTHAASGQQPRRAQDHLSDFVLVRPGIYEGEALPGSVLSDVIGEAINAAQRLSARIRFQFNNVSFTVASDSILKLLERDYLRAIRNQIEKEVGPYCQRSLTRRQRKNELRERNKRWALFSA